jgi:small subunit ribosomal protein S18
VAARAKPGKARDRVPVSGPWRSPNPGGGGRRRRAFSAGERSQRLITRTSRSFGAFISEPGKIKGRGNKGTCRKHQTQVAVAIKLAREIALLPYKSDSEPSTTGSRPRSKCSAAARGISRAWSGAQIHLYAARAYSWISPPSRSRRWI